MADEPSKINLSDGGMTPGPKMPATKGTGGFQLSQKVWMMIVAGLVLVAGALGWMVYSNSTDSTDETPVDEAVATDTTDGTDEASSTDTTTSGLPVVVFSPAGTFTDAEKASLAEMVVNPLVDWNADNGSTVASIMISDLNYGSVTDDSYEYSFDVISLGGVHESFLYTEKGEATGWWFPTCLDECEFTSAFTTKYPEVVDQQ